MYNLAEKLFPIHRSITGPGVRKTLGMIREIIPINIHEMPSGTEVFGWTIPNEWHIKSATIVSEYGETIADIEKNNLHIVAYSVPFSGIIGVDELKKHLYTLPEYPDAIPYITSYYDKRWGFCITQKAYDELKDCNYNVNIDACFKKGSLTYADLLIKGRTEKEILFSTNICHPSLANNEVSGPVVATHIAKNIMDKQGNHRYSYRFVFVPETIGSIVYLSEHLNEMRKNIVAGYVVTCVGDDSGFSYLKNIEEDCLVNRVTKYVFRNSKEKLRLYDFTERGSDERQYCYPGVDLPVGSLMRSKYGDYPEYHSSADNMDFISEDGLKGSLEKYLECVDVLEKNETYKCKIMCEPQLVKHGLYPGVSTNKSINIVKDLRNILAYSNGNRDLLEIANITNSSIDGLYDMAHDLINAGLLEII